MGRFVEGRDRRQVAFLPACLDDYVDADNPVRVIDAFVDELDLLALGFTSVQPASTGRPAYHLAMKLKLYVYTSTSCAPVAGWSVRQAAMSS